MTISAGTRKIIASLIAFGLASCGDNVGSASSPNDAPVRGLPSDATNISYAFLSPNRMYEFDTEESSFRSWVTAQKKPVMSAIQQKQASLLHYDPASKTTDFVSIPDALVSEWTGTQPDEGQHMVYDTRKKRAYFWYHSR